MKLSRFEKWANKGVMNMGEYSEYAKYMQFSINMLSSFCNVPTDEIPPYLIFDENVSRETFTEMVCWASQLYDKKKTLTLADLEKADRYRNAFATRAEKRKITLYHYFGYNILRSVKFCDDLFKDLKKNTLVDVEETESAQTAAI